MDDIKFKVNEILGVLRREAQDKAIECAKKEDAYGYVVHMKEYEMWYNMIGEEFVALCETIEKIDRYARAKQAPYIL